MEGCYRGEITAHHPLCSHAQQVGVGVRNGKRRRSFMMDCSRAKGAWLVTRPRTQRACERALVVWSARQLGLSSETQRGEVGDHV